MKPNESTRRGFLANSLSASAALAAISQGALSGFAADKKRGNKMAYGLVTYQWGKDWDLPKLIANCEKAEALGVELRTTHAHGVEPTLNDRQREDVAKRFADSRVTLVGLGSNERFDNPDPAVVRKAIETSKAFIRLSHDVGGTGVKVKPDRFYKNVPREKTIEQIGKSLNILGEYAIGFGQQVRLEVHGQCAELPTIKAIMDIADNENVAVCWNSNAQDLQGKGLEANYRLVAKRFGATCHVRPLDSTNYPYQKLIDLLVADDYQGWVMLEDGRVPKDSVAALTRQAKLFKEMVARAQASL
ncbi:MAG: sugar phosphate isomerase/epimerase [Planctomycetes bacterium]|nr:sugar phosphate isomerase/epimerase [Planctomycetota bacterium]